MALTVPEAIALANRLLADAQAALVSPAGLLSRLQILPTDWFSNPGLPAYPNGVAYVTLDGRDGILLNIAPGPGGTIEVNLPNPPRITGIDALDFNLFSGIGLVATSLRERTPDFSGDLPGFENIALTVDGGAIAANGLVLSELGALLTSYLNGLSGLPTPPPTRPQLTLDEFKALVASQAPVPYNEFRRAVGTDGPDLLVSLSGGPEIGTGGRGPDAWYLKEFDILTNKKGKVRIAPGNKQGFTLNDYNAAEGDRIFINLEEVRRVLPNFSETEYTLVQVGSKKQLLKAALLGVELIYNKADGRLFLDGNGKKEEFGRGGVIAKVGNVLGLRPEITEKDLVFVTPDALAGPSAPLPLA